MCETWNKAFAVLVGHNHPSVLTAVEAFQSDLAVVEQVMEDAQGQPPVTGVKRSTKLLQKRLRQLCEARCDGKKTVAED